VLERPLLMKVKYPKKKRDYKKEYARDHKPKADKLDRAGRNAAHAEKERNGGVPKGKDVHHKDGNPRNNKRSNLAVMAKSRNRGIK